MNFLGRTIVGGSLLGCLIIVLSFLPFAGVFVPVFVYYVVPLVVAAFVAYYIVFYRVKNTSYRLGAALAVAPIFLALAYIFNEIAGRWLYVMLAEAGPVVPFSLMAVSFIAAVMIVTRAALIRHLRLID